MVDCFSLLSIKSFVKGFSVLISEKIVCFICFLQSVRSGNLVYTAMSYVIATKKLLWGVTTKPEVVYADRDGVERIVDVVYQKVPVIPPTLTALDLNVYARMVFMIKEFLVLVIFLDFKLKL